MYPSMFTHHVWFSFLCSLVIIPVHDHENPARSATIVRSRPSPHPPTRPSTPATTFPPPLPPPLPPSLRRVASLHDLPSTSPSQRLLPRSWQRGDRRHPAVPDQLYGNIGRAFARAGMVGLVMSYRLAPGVQHPEQVRDVARKLELPKIKQNEVIVAFFFSPTIELESSFLTDMFFVTRLLKTCFTVVKRQRARVPGFLLLCSARPANRSRHCCPHYQRRSILTRCAPRERSVTLL